MKSWFLKHKLGHIVVDHEEVIDNGTYCKVAMIDIDSFHQEKVANTQILKWH